MNGTRCPICNDIGGYPSPSVPGMTIECPRCRRRTPNESAGIARTSARAAGLASPVRGRQVPPLGVSQEDLDQVVGELGAFDWRGGVLDPNAKRDPFTLTDDEPEQPSWQRRHDDVCPIKRAFWHGATWGWCVGVVMTAAAVAWRLHGTLLP